MDPHDALSPRSLGAIIRLVHTHAQNHQCSRNKMDLKDMIACLILMLFLFIGKAEHKLNWCQSFLVKFNINYKSKDFDC